MDTTRATYQPAITHAEIPTPMLTASTGSEPGAHHQIVITTVQFQIIVHAVRELRRRPLSAQLRDGIPDADLLELSEGLTGLYRAIIGDGASHGRP